MESGRIDGIDLPYSCRFVLMVIAAFLVPSTLHGFQ